jgi:hypothetical protein
MKYLLIALITGIAFTSCEDDNVAGAPDIDIVSPTSGQVINSGDSVRVAVNVTHEDDLHDVFLEVLDDDLDLVVWDSTVHTHGQSFTFDHKRLVVVLAMTNMKLRVTAEDHNDNVAMDSVAFMFHP